MRNFSLFSLFLLLAIGSLSAQQVFVLFEPGCMLRVRYEQSIAQQPTMNYYAYQIPLADGNKLILETGVEGDVRQNYLPADYMRCNDPRLNADLAEALNGNQAKVFLLVPDGSDYLIQPVTMAAILARQGNLITYVSPLASFQFDTRNAIIGENLAYNNPNARVAFEGRENAICGGNYLINQLMPRNAYPVINYKLNPTLGVLERRLGSDGQSTVGGVTIARDVNGQPITTYMSIACGNNVAANNPASAGPATYGSAPVQGQPFTGNAPTTFGSQPVTPRPVVNQPTSAPAAAPATEIQLHTVVKGETLYGISRRYDVGVDQLKEWNNLSANTILVGDELRVSAPALFAGGTTATPTLAANRGGTTVAGPATYGGAPVQPGQTAQATTTPADQNHIVQSGETVASIALRYGYTEAKFREINGLGPNEIIRIGQRLKTNSCNCPAATASQVSSAANNNVAAPTTFNAGGVVRPQAFNQSSATGQPLGTPVGPTATTFRNPQGFQSPTTNSAPQTFNNSQFNQPQAFGGQTTQPRAFGGQTAQPQTFSRQPSLPAAPSTQGTPRITNDPGFGTPAQQQQSQIIPNVFRGPANGQSMNSLEGNRSTVLGNNRINGQPSTYGNQVSAPNSFRSPAATRSIHVVQEGESLYSIAQRYGLSVQQLRDLNGLQPADVIIPFQNLYIN